MRLKTEKHVPIFSQPIVMTRHEYTKKIFWGLGLKKGENIFLAESPCACIEAIFFDRLNCYTSSCGQAPLFFFAK